MDEKPRFTEFVSRRFGVVKTKDGRYFTFENIKLMRIQFSALRFLLVSISFILMLTLDRNYWHGLDIDAAILIMALFYMIDYAQYRTANFNITKEDSEDYREIFKWRFLKRSGKPISFFLWTIPAIILILSLTNGFCVTWVKSMIEDEGYIASDKVVFYSDTYVAKAGIYEDGGIFILPAELNDESYVRIEIEVNKSPDLIQLVFDGKPVEKYVYRNLYSSWIWEEEYFQQGYAASIDGDAVRDGSVLEMTCGELYRKWVFHLSEEDGG